MRTRVQFTYLYEIETMYEMPRVDAKIEQVSAFTFTHDLSCMPLLYLRAYPRKNNATVEIYLK